MSTKRFVFLVFALAVFSSSNEPLSAGTTCGGGPCYPPYGTTVEKHCYINDETGGPPGFPVAGGVSMLKTTRWVVIVAAVVSPVVSTWANGFPQNQPSPPAEQFITIEGRKNPEQIPEWLAWREAFRNLAAINVSTSSLTKNLMMTTTEADLTVKESRSEGKRETDCASRQEKIQAQLQTASPNVLREALEEDRINCRWTTLDARDRLLESLSPQARISLEGYVNEVKYGITSIVPKSELDIFRKPQ